MQDSPSDEDGAIVHLTSDEAIVLLDLLSRWSDEAGAGETPPPGCFETTAEGAVLNGLLCALEKQLATPLAHDYGHRLDGARRRLPSQWNYQTLRA